MLAPTAQGTNPWKSRIHQFLFKSEQDHTHSLANIHAVYARDRAPTGARTAGQAQIRKLGPKFAFLTFC
jgi:hypothetical protein